MKIKSPSELLKDQIRDLFDVETQVSRTMPELASQSPDQALRDFFSAQAEVSLRQMERLKRAAATLGSTPEGDTCKAMKGLIEGGNEHIASAEGSLVTNLILIAHVNRIILYQIAGYEFSDALANQLGISEVNSLLDDSLREEGQAAQGLAKLAAKIYSGAAMRKLRISPPHRR